MTDLPDTQHASLAVLASSGRREQLTQYVLDTFRTHGPMPDWMLYTVAADSVYDRPTILARRNELTVAGTIGYTDATLLCPKTGKPGKVWGIIGEHKGARVYQPQDKVSVRVKNQRHSMAFAYGALQTMSDAELGGHIRTLLAGE